MLIHIFHPVKGQPVYVPLSCNVVYNSTVFSSVVRLSVGAFPLDILEHIVLYYGAENGATPACEKLISNLCGAVHI